MQATPVGMAIVEPGAADRMSVLAVVQNVDHEAAVAGFVHFLDARGCSPNTVKAYLHDLKFLFAYLSQAGMSVERFAASDLIGWSKADGMRRMRWGSDFGAA